MGFHSLLSRLRYNKATAFLRPMSLDASRHAARRRRPAIPFHALHVPAKKAVMTYYHIIRHATHSASKLQQPSTCAVLHRVFQPPVWSGRLPNSFFLLAESGWLQSELADGSSACPVTEPIWQRTLSYERLTGSGKHDGADSLLLTAQVVFK